MEYIRLSNLCKSEPLVKESEKFFLSYECLKKGRVVCREVVKHITNSYLESNDSITKLKKRGTFSFNCHDHTGINPDWESRKLSFDIIEDYILERCSFSSKDFNLPERKCTWLDGDLHLAMSNHIVGIDGKSVRLRLGMSFGPDFPIVPTLDREGVLYNSLQNPLAKRITLLHNELVTNSNRMLEDVWFFDLISLITLSLMQKSGVSRFLHEAQVLSDCHFFR